MLNPNKVNPVSENRACKESQADGSFTLVVFIHLILAGFQWALSGMAGPQNYTTHNIFSLLVLCVVNILMLSEDEAAPGSALIHFH